MRKQLRQYLRRSLCGVLSAAMILTGSAIPDLAVQAVQANVEDFTETDEQINETPSAETNENDEIGNPVADNDVADGVENTDQDDSGQKDEEISDEQGEDGSVGTEDDDEKLADDEADAEDGDDMQDDEEEAENAADFEKILKGVMAVGDGTEGEYGTLSNGDFEGDFEQVGEVWVPKAWKFSPEFTGRDGGGFETQTIDKEKYGDNSLYIYKGSETDISVSQVIPNMEPGAYMVVLDAGGVYSKDQITLKVESVEQKDDSDEDYTDVLAELATQSLGECDAWGKWNAVETGIFEVEVPVNETEVNVKITISGKIGIDSKAEQIHIDNVEFVTYKLADLQELLTSVADLEEADYTAETWTTFAEKKEAAQDLVNDSATTDEAKALEIMQAYLALEKAKEELKSSSTDVEVTFYYYAGETDDEIGLYYWDNSGENNISTTADPIKDWYIWKADDTYKMTKVTGYAGWYSIPITFKNSGTGAGFQVYTKANSGTNDCEYKCDETDNKEVYAALTSGENKTGAVKKKIAYIGTYDIGKADTQADKAAMIMRNIKLNIYSEEMIPVIQLDNSSAAKKLSVVNEEDGSISDLTPSGQDSNNNNVYEMQKLEEESYWYTLSFSVPGAIGFDNAKIGGLFEKTDKGYVWSKNLMNGKDDEWGFDFTPVFDGKTYCKYEHEGDTVKLTFYSTMEEAESVTLAQLKELLESEAFKKIEKKGETGYTEDSWKAFSEAKTAATKVVSDNADKADDFASTDITTAYKNLKSAMDAMVSLSVDVTFYYYAGDMEEEEEIGLYHWGADITSTAENAKWTVWGADDTYSMTAVEGYAGWYSIPISFTNNGKDAGFQIFKKSVALSENDADKVAEYICEASKGDTEFFAKVISGDDDSYAVKNGVGYAGSSATAIMRQVTLYVYNNVNTPYLHMGKATADSLSVVDETTGTLTSLEAAKVTESDGKENNAYALQQDETYQNWYYITFSAPGKFEADSAEKVCNLYEKDSTDSYVWVKDFMNGPTGKDWEVDFTSVFAGMNYYKDGKFYATLEEADPDANLTLLDKLQNLVDEAKKLKKDDYKETGWKEFTDALVAAESVLQAAKVAETDATKTAPTEEEIKKAYDDLKTAMDALVPASVQQAEINVKKVALTDDFITGADLSSYIALKDSGVVFKDENGKPLSDQGFFNYLHDGGMNYVRIRIWNDPYTSSGNGYGGGNNDLEKAIRLGQLATNAKMRVLIDFHYSDFWADPKKQKAPKAWAGYSIDQKEKAVYDFTLDSLNALRNAGVDVGMVQVGNETNNGIAGETNWDNMARLFNAGSKAVREFDKECLVAVHFTDPQKGYGAIAERLDKSNVDYDVFASSYYPFGHGDAANLKDVLKYVVETYGKKVMAAETSWPTTLVDGDGYGTATPPTVPEQYESQNYGVSVQGQADEMYDLIKAVNEINDDYAGSSLGVFYWEPAWISPYYIKDDEGNDIDSLYKQNYDLWEKYGSGWASSYAAEYDPDDAGVWFGGSAMDNSSWFDFDGTALPTAKIYSLIRTGAEAERKIASVESNPVMKVELGEEIDWANVKVKAKYNDRTETELPVTWEESETELVNTYKAGEYIVHGIVSEAGKNYNIKLTVQVLRDPANNILENPDFENNSVSPWVVDTRLGHGETEADSVVNVTKEDPHSGTLGLHFWSKIGLDFTVSQTVTPEAGTYTFGSYIQGGGADSEDVQYSFVKVTDKDGKLKSNLKTTFALNGWNNWVNPEITGITVEAGDTMEVGLIMKSTQDGAWGTMDDFYLYGTHTVSIAENIEHGTVETNVVKADSGDKITVTVTPESGYYPAKVILSGASITDKTLTSSNGSVTYVPAAGETTNQAVLTYTEKTAEVKSETFTMPKGNVMVSAEFVSVFEAGAEKISLDAKENGKYLVEVNAGESKDSAGEAPIADQFYTGKDIKPAVQLSYKGYQLTAADYTVSYSINKNMTTADSKAKITLTAKGEKFTGTREIPFEIKEDTRQDFNAKKLKVVFEASDKNGRTDKAAQAVYYLGTEKEIEPKISLYNVADDIADKTKAIDPSMYEVYYQNNRKVGKATLVVLPSEKAQGMTDGYKEGSITSTFTIAKCPINQRDVTITMSDKLSYYTGRKAEPAVTVTYGYKDQNGEDQTVTLVKGRDYTVTYTNNMNASVYEVKDEQGNTTGYQAINPKKVPTVKITGKGNFAGVRTTYTVDEKGKAGTDKITFEICPRSITNTTITVADLAESGKAQAPKITVKDGGKAVAANQYVIEKIVRTHDGENKALDKDDMANTIYSREPETGTPKVTEAGTYQITIAGKEKSNYTDISNELTFKVVTKNNLIANTKITISGKFYYSGDQVTLSTSGENPNLTVKAGVETLTGFKSRSEAKKDGVEQDGYYVTYSNNVSAGRATITVNGTGKYVGAKTSTFMINKRTLAKQVSESDKDKKGAIQTPELSVKVAKEKLDGVWIPDAADATDDAKGALINSDKEESGSLEIPYTGYTINPDFKFNSDNYYDGLEEGTSNVKEIATGDYTVSYKVGKWENGKAPVSVTVKGKGNYSGSVKFDNLFTLTERDFSELSIEVASVTYNGKALKPAVTFYNEDGKVVDLKLNTAYTVTYKNNKEANQKPDKQPTVTVKQKGKGWGSASGSITKTFTIEQAEITRADIEDVKFQTFLGKALKPKVTVKVNGRKLKEGKDYMLAYSKNVKRGGTATVTITGKGNYFTRQPIVKNFVIK
ncbi:MAG: hypothetical protein HDR04_05960 [Lachnospiraceae bacterium]|nr:hypothetical protein [Lachnospiraceae bacterium]